MEVLAFSDIDGTMAPGFLLFPVAGALQSEGVITRGHNSDIQDRLQQFNAGELGYKSFAEGALQSLAGALAGIGTEAVRSVTMQFLEDEPKFYPWVRPTFDEIHSQGGTITIVSAEPDFITEAVANVLDSGYLATELGVDSGGMYTGIVTRPLGSSQKGESVRARIQRANDVNPSFS